MKIKEDFNKSLKNSDFSKISTDIVEKLIDNEISNEILKEIPILKTIMTFWNLKKSIPEYLLTKKIIHFLNNIKEISSNKRLDIIEKIDSSNEFKTSVGEKLLYLISRADDIEKAEILGLLFKELLKENISYYSFIRYSKIIELTIDEELEFFTNYLDDRIEIDRGSHYISLNLYDIKFDKPKLIEEENTRVLFENSLKYKLEDLNIYAEVNNFGKELRKILKKFYY
jgi:hypothetical protein